jgi:cytochrome c biogenesis protein CcdA
MKKLLLVFLAIIALSVVFAEECSYIIFFYQTGCHACSIAEPILDSLEEEYDVIIDRRELHETGNYYLFLDYMDWYGVPEDERGFTPTTFINDIYIVGYDSSYEQTIINAITNCPEGGCFCPFNQSLADYYDAPAFPEVNASTGFNLVNNGATRNTLDLTIPTIITAALIDSINPCAFAVMIFLLTYLVNIGSKKRVIKVGSFYILTVFITYFLAGLGLFLAVQTTNMSRFVYYLAAIIAIIAGLINVKDFFWYGKGITLRIPQKAKPAISKWTKKASIPSAIILGFLVSLFELPCTGGVYLAILGLLSNNLTRFQAILPLALYNFIFVLPLIILMGLVYWGVSSKILEKWRKEKRNYMKLVSGLFMVLLGALMIGGLI